MSLRMTNLELAQNIAKYFPQFKQHTAKITDETFTARGYDAINQVDPTFIQDYFGLSVRVWLNIVNISHAKDPLASKGFGEIYDQPFGGVIQRMSVDSIKPISPAFDNLQNLSSVDPFIVRKPESRERFWKQNFKYQSMVTIPDDYALKQIFISEYGMSEYMAGIMEGLQNGYITQAYLNKLEAINAAINSTATPLKDSQKVTVTLSDDPTDAELKTFLLQIMNVLTMLTEVGSQTKAFNAYGFTSTQDKGRLKLLMRAGLQNDIKVKTLLGAFNPEFLNLGVDIIPVDNFGGITYTNSSGTAVYPVYDSIGQQIGFNETQGATTVTVTNDDAVPVDHNANTVAILADKGVIFECRQNEYRVEPQRNARGLYTNYFASVPNNTVAYDSLYNLVAFQKSS